MRIALWLLPYALLAADAGIDLDRDGIDDAHEQQLLERFAPTFYIGADECDGRPSSFTDGPRALAQDGTIYGQVSPHQRGIEIHYYHLWRNDCGSVPHPLDAEHVSVLLDASGERALYWFAAAHQDTLCDASQAATASSIDAVAQGAHVWISAGKHASYLEPAACVAGCGEDRCILPVALQRGRIVNIGERGAPLNGATWIASNAWPLAAKMGSDFPPGLLARLDEAEGVLSVSTAPRGMRRTIEVSSSVRDATRGAIAAGGRGTGGAIAAGGRGTGGALATSTRQTGGAISTGGRETDSAIERSLSETGKALGAATQASGRFLRLLKF